MKYKIATSFCLIVAFCIAQNQYAHWTFANSLGLNFNTMSPTLENSSAGFVSNATISDSNGNLLFYTDGQNVYNKQHQVMDNGTGIISTSTAQSLIIIPFEAQNIYYIYHFITNITTISLAYTKVDMSFNGGLGKVVEKNQIVLNDVNDFLSAVKIPCEEAYWIVLAKFNQNSSDHYNSDTIYTLKVNTNGIVQTNINLVNTLTTGLFCLKFAPNGKYLAVSDSYYHQLDFYNFNLITGQIGTIYRHYDSLPNPTIYPNEFSPDSSKFYFQNNSTYNLNQVDLIANIINNTNITLNTETFDFKLAINGKVYFSNYPNNISVLENPNANFDQLVFSQNAISTIPNEIYSNFPTIIPNLNIKPAISFIAVENPCATYQFSINSNVEITSILWDFGDGFTSNQLYTQHTFLHNANYTITATYTTICGETKTLTQEILVSQFPEITSNGNVTFCSGENIPALSVTATSGATVNWYNSATSTTILATGNSFTPTSAGIFYVEAVLGNCKSARIAMSVTQNPMPTIQSNGDKDICENESIPALSVTATSDAIINWYSSITSTTILATGNSFTPTSAGTFYAEAVLGNCKSARIAIVVNVHTLPNATDIELGENYIIVHDTNPENQYSLDNIHYQNSGIFQNLNYGGNYILHIRNQYCSIEIPLQLPLNDSIFIPNIISPNGDGINDNWVIKDLQKFPNSDVWIFDRYGKQIFYKKTEGYQIFVWQPNYLEKDLPSTSYWYLIILNNGRKFNGFLVIKNRDKK